MNTREAIAARILELCKERGITPNGLSNISAVPQATIKSILNGESQNPGAVTIKNCVMALKLRSVSSFLPQHLTLWSKKSIDGEKAKKYGMTKPASRASVATLAFLLLVGVSPKPREQPRSGAGCASRTGRFCNERGQRKTRKVFCAEFLFCS